MGFKETALPNGLKILIYTKSTIEKVGIAFGFRYGSIDCSLEKKEVAHYLEHMLFKGTKNRSWSDINNMTREYGIDLNAETGYETTIYEAGVYKRYYARALDLMIDMIRNAKLPAKDMANELGTILHELAIRKDDPDDILDDNMPYALYRSRAVISSGTGESVRAISRNDLLRAYEMHYSPGNAAVAVCGGVDMKQAYSIVKKGMSSFTRGRTEPSRKDLVARPIRNMQIKRKDISREMVGIGFDVGGMPKGDVVRYITLKALAEILNNRIYDEVREKSGLSYDPGVEYELHESFGYILASAGSEPGKSSAVKRKILEECRNLADRGITKKELDRVRHGMRIDFELLKENPVDMATAMLDMELKGINGKNMLFIGKALDRVTVQGVEKYAKRYIDTDRCSTIMLKKY